MPRNLAADSARIFGLACAALSFLLVAPGHAADAAASSGGFSAGLTVQPVASAEDIGLPIYPGARLYRERDRDNNDSAGADLNIWGGSFGMRLQALKLQTPDSIDAVARYYREAMARYGRVLDCGNQPDSRPDNGSDEPALRCDKERPKAGSRLFKVGTKRQVRIVSIEPAKDAAGGATQVQMLRIEFKRD